MVNVSNTSSPLTRRPEYRDPVLYAHAISTLSCCTPSGHYGLRISFSSCLRCPHRVRRCFNIVQTIFSADLMTGSITSCCLPRSMGTADALILDFFCASHRSSSLLSILASTTLLIIQQFILFLGRSRTAQHDPQTGKRPLAHSDRGSFRLAGSRTAHPVGVKSIPGVQSLCIMSSSCGQWSGPVFQPAV